MLDIRLLREDRASVERAMELRGMPGVLAPVVEADERYRELLRDVEALRAQHNQASKQLGRTKERPPELLDELRVLGERIAEDQKATKDVKDRLDALLLELPNLPHPERARREGRERQPGRRARGRTREFDFEPRPHWEIGREARHHRLRARRQDLRHALLRAEGAGRPPAARADHVHAGPAHRASTATRRSTRRTWSSSECLVRLGQLPKFADNLYHDAEEDLY